MARKPFGFNNIDIAVIKLFLLDLVWSYPYHLKALLEANAEAFSARHRGKGRDLLLVDVAMTRFSASKSEFKWLRRDPFDGFRPST